MKVSAIINKFETSRNTCDIVELLHCAIGAKYWDIQSSHDFCARVLLQLVDEITSIEFNCADLLRDIMEIIVPCKAFLTFYAQLVNSCIRNNTLLEKFIRSEDQSVVLLTFRLIYYMIKKIEARANATFTMLMSKISFQNHNHGNGSVLLVSIFHTLSTICSQQDVFASSTITATSANLFVRLLADSTWVRDEGLRYLRSLMIENVSSNAVRNQQVFPYEIVKSISSSADTSITKRFHNICVRLLRECVAANDCSIAPGQQIKVLLGRFSSMIGGEQARRVIKEGIISSDAVAANRLTAILYVGESGIHALSTAVMLKACLSDPAVEVRSKVIAAVITHLPEELVTKEVVRVLMLKCRDVHLKCRVQAWACLQKLGTTKITELLDTEEQLKSTRYLLQVR